MKNLHQLLQKNKNIPDIELIIAYCLSRSREFLFIHSEYQPTILERFRICRAGQLRQRGCPLAYITGHKDFFGLNFEVNKHTLIPRPETEMLIEEVLKNNNIKTIADLGTGSGCIAITLAKQNPNLSVYASDISNSALAVARRNATFHQTKITFFQGDLLTPLKNISLDAIVANFPYVDIALNKQTNDTLTNGLKFEPSTALYATDHGLAVFKKFFVQLSALSHLPQYIYLEIGADQGEALKQIALSHLPKANIEIKKDLCNRDRLITIKNS